MKKIGWGTLIPLALALLHAALALAYASVTPYLQPGYTNEQLLPDIGAPDEYSHIAYVDHVHRYQKIPILKPGTEEAKTLYEAHQPPLFYVLNAGWYGLFGDHVPSGPGVALRSMNALVGAGIVLGVYCFALWGYGRQRMAIFAAAVAALLPMLCALDGAASNDPLVILFCTWTLALIVRWRESWSVQRSLLVGALAGLAILTKASGLLLIPPVLAAIWLGGGARFRNASAAFAAIVVLGVPWLARNIQVYGDPLAMSAFYAVFPRGVWPAQVFSGLRPFARWLYVLAFGTALSSVGIFGYMDIHLRYRYYIPILLLLVAGLLTAAWSRRRSRASDEPGLEQATLPIGLFTFLVVASFVSYNLWQVQPQARYLFPLIAPLSAWVVLGLERLWTRPTWALPLLLCLWLAAADFHALRTLPGEFQKRVDAARAMGAKSPL